MSILFTWTTVIPEPFLVAVWESTTTHAGWVWKPARLDPYSHLLVVKP